MQKSMLAIAILLTVALYSTGLDYVTGDVSHDDERFFTADVMTWGATALVIAVVVTVALLGRWTRVLAVGALAAGIMYLLFAVNQATVILAQPVLDDWRTGMNMLVFAGCWLTVSGVVSLQNYVDTMGDPDGDR